MCCFSGFGTLARWSSPSHPFHTPSEHVVQPCHCWEVPFAAALGCPAAFQVQVFHFLKGNRLTILYRNQHFGLFIPLGEKKSYCSGSNQQPSGLAEGSLHGAGGAGDHWSLLASADTQHISLVPLSVTFSQERIKVPTQA